MRIFEHANYNFIGNRKKAYIFSGLLLLAGILSILVRGVEVGIDFTGGTAFIVETDQDLDVTQVREALARPLGQEPEVVSYGEDALLIRTGGGEEGGEIQQQIVQSIQTSFAGSNPVVVGSDIVGPRFAADLAQGALYSILGSLLVMFVYILIRFEWRFGLGAVLCPFHDVICILGLFSLLHGLLPFSLQIDQTIIAAFLTIVGYSINDTVVVYDRIRESANIFKTESFPSLVNRAINATLSRTVITGCTTLLSLVVLFIFGGEVLRGFAFALFIGIVLGTYSSIFVAAPIVVELHRRSEARRV